MRAGKVFDGDQRRIELAYAPKVSLPGTPVLRYGDEIGMGNDLSIPERDYARTPMQWTGGDEGEFIRGAKPVSPPTGGGAYGYEQVERVMDPLERPAVVPQVEVIVDRSSQIPRIIQYVPEPTL